MILFPIMKHEKHHRTCQRTEFYFDVESNLVQYNSEKNMEFVN